MQQRVCWTHRALKNTCHARHRQVKLTRMQIPLRYICTGICSVRCPRNRIMLNRLKLSLRKAKRTRMAQYLKAFINVRNQKKRNYIRGKGNTIKKQGVIFDLKTNIIGNNNDVTFASGCNVVQTSLFIRGNNNRLIVEKGVEFTGWFRIMGNNCLIHIGEGTTVSQASLQAVESDRKILIGKDCMLSVGITIFTSDYHSIIDRDTGRRINHASDVIVKDHVWIGANALLLKGITVGDGSIIGAEAVVTRDVPANTVVAGNPAKIVSKNVDWSRDRDI